MSNIFLGSHAERMAETAEHLNAFSGIKLLHIKKQIALILAQIGRNGIFDEYTKHDITHIDYMLESLDFIIPEETKALLTPADWLMITLSIYFHDLGMLVTKEEFLSRNETYFREFKQTILEGGYGADYRDKILNIEDIYLQDRFIYQELVRKTHAERIRYWILNESNPNFNIPVAITTEIQSLLANLDPMFRRDLALICESHNLSDLDNFEKYKPDTQYGRTVNEQVNLHYAAILLRTTDLLHITSDRTPSVEFKLINPTDPISQQEWAKQRAVKAIRPKAKRRDGVVDNSIRKDTLEVIAHFEDESGFFGLIAYLKYANDQLKETYRLNELRNKKFSDTLLFPWRYIDDSNIETKDFERRQFEFVLDQTRILDLLVGHTLYNDYTVVLRELTQNGIDAVKLRKYEYNLQSTAISYTPEIQITWEENLRELSFVDNGTGMTLDIIENHLLKVGSSRYQDEYFRKSHPDFSPISRFGIGLLTCFLVADDVDILTKSSETEKGILLRIKKVHGKYLLKYVQVDELPEHIRKHGTEIKLFIRADVNLENIAFELKKWILIPDCKVFFINKGATIPIGVESPRMALEKVLIDNGYTVDDINIKIIEFKRDGLDFAVALQYLEHWKEWKFLFNAFDKRRSTIGIGTCIEGIKVEFDTPGFNGAPLFAVLNTTGKSAPKTNVARSNIELTPEREHLLLNTYKIYLSHISNEIEDLQKNFSITWASKEIVWLLNSLISNKRYGNRGIKLENVEIFNNALSDLSCILIENHNTRNLVSLNELRALKEFWSIDCKSYSSVNSLMREVKSAKTSALSLFKSILGEENSHTAHIQNLLGTTLSGGPVDRLILDNFTVTGINLITEQRRLDLKWALREDKIWEEVILDEDDSNILRRCYIQIENIDIINNANTSNIIKSSNATYFLKTSKVNAYFINLLQNILSKSPEDIQKFKEVVKLMIFVFSYKNITEKVVRELIENRIDRNGDRAIQKTFVGKIDREEFINVAIDPGNMLYDTTVWDRRDDF